MTLCKSLTRGKINKTRWNACKIITKRYAVSTNLFLAFYLLITWRSISNFVQRPTQYNSAPSNVNYFCHFTYSCIIWHNTGYFFVGMFQNELKKVTAFSGLSFAFQPVCWSVCPHGRASLPLQEFLWNFVFEILTICWHILILAKVWQKQNASHKGSLCT